MPCDMQITLHFALLSHRIIIIGKQYVRQEFYSIENVLLLIMSLIFRYKDAIVHALFRTGLSGETAKNISSMIVSLYLKT